MVSARAPSASFLPRERIIASFSFFDERRSFQSIQIQNSSFKTSLLRRPESLAILKRIDKAIDHRAEISRAVEQVYPLQEENVRVAVQVAEVFHDDERF